VSAENWDWSFRVFDHVDVHAGDFAESVRFYETVLEPLGMPKLVERDANGDPGYRDYGRGYYAAYLLDPDGNNVEPLYRDVGNIGHAASPKLG
jgi:catechol 2,3-dioxygenase-like lactoylglutathione lyase family enzyme